MILSREVSSEKSRDNYQPHVRFMSSNLNITERVQRGVTCYS